MKKLGYLFVSFAFGCISLWMLWIFVKNIQNADSNIKAGLIGLFGMLAATLITHIQAKKREINSRHFADKREGYMHVIDLMFELIESSKSGKNVPEDRLIQKMMEFKKSMIVWGGVDVIEAWNHYEMELQNNPSDVLKAMETILRAIRADLGHDDSSMEFGSLAGLVIQASDKHMVLGHK